MGFLNRIKAAAGEHDKKPEESRTCERCRNFTYCKRRAMNDNATCENYDEKA